MPSDEENAINNSFSITRELHYNISEIISKIYYRKKDYEENGNKNQTPKR